jgi:hypothetical protein
MKARITIGGDLARITIEYGPDRTAAALDQVGWRRLQNQEKRAWMTGAIRVPNLRSVKVKFELLDKPRCPSVTRPSHACRF